MLSRRGFLRISGTMVTSAAAVGLYAWRIEPHWLEVTHRELPVEGLPVALRGCTLAHVSDLHAGHRVDPHYLASALELLRGLAPDLVVYTGDFVSFRWRAPRLEMEPVLRHFARGRIATIAILGNHDYGPGWNQPAFADGIVRRLRDAGATVLRNEVASVRGLAFVGLDDWWAHRFDLARACAALDPHTPAVWLCHNPDAADLPGWEGRRGWILAGHTHGGQVKPPFLPPPLLPVRNRRYVAGEVAVADGRRLYISRGVGHLLPVRFGVRPEIALFSLVPASVARRA